MRSRSKGKRGELELAAFLGEHLVLAGARRGRQERSGHTEPDVVGVPGWWVEGKRAEQPRLRTWLTKLVADIVGARSPDRPLLAWRHNRGSWWAVVRLVDWCELVRSRAHLEAENSHLRSLIGEEVEP